MALLQASASASSEAEISISPTPCSWRNSCTSSRAGVTSLKSHCNDVRKVTQAGAFLGRHDLSFGFNDLKNSVQTGEFENLLDRWRRVDQAHRDRTVTAVDELVDGDQRAQPATIDKVGIG